MRIFFPHALSIIVMLGAVSCSTADEPTPSTPPIEDETTNEAIYMSYEEAMAAGLPCLNAEHYGDEIYPEKTVDLILPKDGREVELRLLSMANVRNVKYKKRDGGDLLTDFPPTRTFKDKYVICTTEDCYVFSPYTITTVNTLVVTHESPEVIKFKIDPEYKYRGGCFYLYLFRHPNLAPFDTRYTPDLWVSLHFEE
ncbi:MAG: hypothetical protein NC418_00250 [Muribaculaceae bacterium]|nr:hypothetical protein [Muribaculaceae bacterium]